MTDYISVYTDEDALRDGVLIDISYMEIHFKGRPVNRMTAHFYCTLSPYCASESDPFLPTLKSIIAAKLRYARDSAGSGESKGNIYILHGGISMWLVLNELRGFTLMMPEDY